MSTPIRVVIVDDQTLVREGVAALLALHPDLDVVGLAADGPAALALVGAQRPDVALVDVRMPGMNGVAVAREIRAHCPSTRVVMLTTFDDDEYVFAALQAGAAGYLLKNADPQALAAAVRAAAAGQSILDPAVTRKVILRANAAPEAPYLHERLTGRERDVLRLLASGHANPAIAAQLHLSEGTVKNHVTHILEKLGARDRAHAARLAVEWGLLDEDAE